jgi:hypothetical protein
MFLSRVVPLALVVAAVACSSAVDLFPIDTTPRPPTNPDSIQVLAEEPQRPYKVIALVSAFDGSGFRPKSARRRLMEAAARLGGDAVLLGTESLRRVATGGELGGTSIQVSGKVIVFDREARSN